MLPQGLGLIKEMFAEREMGSAFGMFGPVMGLSSVGGPILAGWLIDADLFGTGWRMIFLINLPLGLLALLGGLRVPARVARGTGRRGSTSSASSWPASPPAGDLPAGAGPRARLAGVDVRGVRRRGRGLRRVRLVRGAASGGRRRPARRTRACSASAPSPAA